MHQRVCSALATQNSAEKWKRTRNTCSRFTFIRLNSIIGCSWGAPPVHHLKELYETQRAAVKTVSFTFNETKVEQCQQSLQLIRPTNPHTHTAQHDANSVGQLPISPLAHYRERRDKLASLRKKNIRRQLVTNWRIFTFCISGTNGLSIQFAETKHPTF